MPGGGILRKTEMGLQFTKTEQNRGLKHLHIDSRVYLEIRKCAAESVSELVEVELANRGFSSGVRSSLFRQKENSKETRSPMNRRSHACLSSVAVLCMLTCLGLAGNALAQDAQEETPHPRYMVMPPHLRTDVAPPAASLQSWNGSFTYGSTNYTYNMVGAAPSSQYHRNHYDLHHPGKDRDHGTQRVENHLRSVACALQRQHSDDQHSDLTHFRFDHDIYTRWSQRGDDPVH